MSVHNLRHVVGLLAALLMLSAAPGQAQTFDVMRLLSPNEQQFGNFGNAVSGAGDVNQDGYADVIVGALQEDPGKSPFWAGRAYVLSGWDGSLLLELMSPNEEEEGLFGVSVAAAGDVNQDGFADVIVGAYKESPGQSPFWAGRAYVFNGQDGSLLFELASPNEEVGGFFGLSVAGAGDVDQDGRVDVIVGAPRDAPGSSPDDAGRAYIFSGQDGGLLFELASPNQEVFGNFGAAVSGAADVDQDGHADVIIGAHLEDPGTSPDETGRAYVFSGQDGSLLFELISPNEAGSGHFGVAVSDADDVNQDGFADVIVGAEFEVTQFGRAYVFSGQDGSVLLELVSPNEGQVNGFFGRSVDGAGDVDQDGFADLIVGAHEASGNSPPFAGRAYLQWPGREPAPGAAFAE